jgi:PBSX family phage terminase large subunit
VSRANTAAVMDALPLAVALLVKQRESGRPLYVPPTFRGGNLAALVSADHESMNGGPAETGKTYECCYKLDSLMRETPRARAMIVRKVHRDMPGTVLETFARIIAIRGGVEVFGGENPLFYQYPNGGRVHVVGLDNPGKALSSERDFIYVNQAEQLTADDWGILTSRATGRGAVTKNPQVFGDCNPGQEKHWIKTRPSLRLFESRHEDNPTLFDEAGVITPQGTRTMEILNALPGVLYKRLRLGRWISAEGTVYDFDPARHVIARSQMPACSRHIVSIDFGYTNPFVAQLWAIDADGRMYLEHEIYMTGRTVEQHAQSIKAMCTGKTIEAYVADPADAEGRATLHAHNIPVRPAMNAISDGIQAVQARMAIAADGKPRLFLVEGALMNPDPVLVAKKRPLCTQDEEAVYVWAKDASGRPIKEEPVKENDHGQDAKRYAVKYVDAGCVDGKVEVVFARASASRPTAARVRLF